MSRLAATTKRILILLSNIVLHVIVLTLFVWACGAVYYFEPLPSVLRLLLAAAYFVAGTVCYFRVQPKTRWLQLMTASIAVVYLLSLVQRPSNVRNWAPDNAVSADVIISANDVHISGFRHSVYRSETDFDVRFRDFQFRLSDLERVWFVVQRFTPLEGIAHNFLTFSLQTDQGPQYFSVSVEIRREEGESFHPATGLYRQYELIYIFADERDEIGARTVLRPNDRVFMYPVNATPKQVGQLFVDIAGRMQKLQQQPEFYHSLMNNCTNNIVNHAYKFTPLPISSLDPRVVAPGFADRLAFAKELIGRPGESFEDLQRRCRIDEVAREVGISDSFSADIRRISVHTD